MRLVLCFLMFAASVLGQISGAPSYLSNTIANYTISAASHVVGIMIRLPQQAEVAAVIWYADSVSTGDTVRVSIQTASSFRPSGTILASGTSSVTAAGWYKTTFASPVTLSADTDYFIVWDYPSYSGGNITVRTASHGFLFPSVAASLGVRYDGSAWTATYSTALTAPAVVLLDSNGFMAPQTWYPGGQNVSSTIGSGSRYAIEFTAARALRLTGMQWFRYEAAQQAAVLVRLYRDGIQVFEVTVPNLGVSANYYGPSYVLFPSPVYAAPGTRIKIVLQVTSGTVNCMRLLQSEQHADMWPVWNRLGRLFPYMANPVSGFADSSDQITNTSLWHAVFPLVESYTPLSGGFVVQQ